MRIVPVLAAAAMLAFASSASASVIVQNLSATEDFGGDFAPYDIYGTAFNPNLGTLTGVTATLTGSYTPIVDLSGGPYPSRGIVGSSYYLYPTADFADKSSGNLGPQVIKPAGGIYHGTPTAVDLTFEFASALSAFVSSASSPISLVEFAFLSDMLNRGRNAVSDMTTFKGNLALTYTYSAVAVPEPPTLLLLGLAVGLLVFLKPRRAV